MPIINNSDWNSFLSQHPNPHLLQTVEWGELKSKFGWWSTNIIVGDTGAQILQRKLPLGFTLAYIPKGPIGSDWDKLWPEIDKLCLSSRAVFLKIEPDAWEGEEISDWMRSFGFRSSAHVIQPRRTISLDISCDDEEILAQMKQKTRYNIRLAGKKGVEVTASSDVGMFSQLMGVTGKRDEFGTHSLAYYQRAYDLFHPVGACELLIAFYEGEPLAGLMVFATGKRAWYFYGASNNLHRNLMPTYLLQWEAIRWAKEKGCAEYDLWGVPDEDQEVLEDKFTQRSDGLWGVYRFKRGFGGEINRSAGAWDKVYNPMLYAGYKMMVKLRGGYE